MYEILSGQLGQQEVTSDTILHNSVISVKGNVVCLLFRDNYF